METIHVSGPYNNEEDAEAILDRCYGGEEGPFWTEADDSGNWWIVAESDYYD